jgi:hypothetical protein
MASTCRSSQWSLFSWLSFLLPMSATSIAYLILLDLIVLITIGKE